LHVLKQFATSVLKHSF